jgi:RND family efflux transporter MFP subunit
MGFAGAVGYGWWQYQGTQAGESIDAPILHTVTKEPFDHIVLEQGEIESSSNIEVKCEVKGKGSGTQIIWVIDEGSYVKKGDELVKLDSSSLESDFKSQRIILSAADAAVVSADAAVRQALIAREEYLKGTYLTERKAILSEIAVAQQGLRKAELALDSAERLAAKGTLKALQIEAEQFAVQNARNMLDAAQGRLKVLDELTKEKMLVQFDSDIETKRAKLASDQSTANEEKEKLLEIERQIKACTIASPRDGQVVHANKMSSRGGSEFVVEPGSIVREQQTIIYLPDPTQMQVKAKVNESRIALVREGMPCKLRVSAFEGELLGQVVKINKYAEPGSWFSSSVKEYATFVQIKNPPEGIRTGMTAEVRIFVEQIPEAVQIPVLAVYELQNHHFALVKNGDDWQTREINLGATNEKSVTIDKGLESGDQVVLNPRKHQELMKLPKIEEVDDRDKLADIAQQPVAKPEGNGRGEGGGGGPGGGGPGGGGPGGGGPGGGDPAAIAEASIGRNDKDSDGKISKDEASGSQMLSQNFDTTDLNKDGFVDKSEMTAAIRKRMAQGGGGPGGGRGPGGPGGERGPGGPGGGPGGGMRRGGPGS